MSEAQFPGTYLEIPRSCFRPSESGPKQQKLLSMQQSFSRKATFSLTVGTVIYVSLLCEKNCSK